MAKLVFSECDGRVVRIDTKCQDDSTLFRIKLDREQIWLPVTGFALDVGGNYQFLHTLSDFVYFYGFGDRVGELVVTGMAFIKNSCRPNDFTYDFSFWNGAIWDDNSSRWSTNSLGIGQSIDGIQNLWDLYERYNFVSRGNTKALEVRWGNVQTFYGFLTGMRVEVMQPDVPIAQYTLRIHVIRMN